MRKADVVSYVSSALGGVPLKQKSVRDKAMYLKGIICAQIADMQEHWWRPWPMSLGCLQTLEMKLDWALGAPRYLIVNDNSEKREATSCKAARKVAVEMSRPECCLVYIRDRATGKVIAVRRPVTTRKSVRWYWEPYPMPFV